MWVFRGLVFILLLFALVYFFVTNSGQVLDINLFGREFLQISIYWVVAVCFLLGFATNFILAALREFRFQRTISLLKKQVTAKDREIHELRTLPLKEHLTEKELNKQRKAAGSD